MPDFTRTPLICTLVLSLVLLTVADVARADDAERKTLTVVGANAGGVGGSQINSEIIEECIQTLPSLDQLQPITDARSEFLKAINGDIEHNASVRSYSAVVDVTYSIYQKKLVVVTTSSIERSEPVFREVEGRFDRLMQFRSNPENGDSFAGRDLAKDFYFSTPEAAIADAKRRAEAWINQKKAFLCHQG